MVDICRAVMAVERTLGVSLPNEDDARINFDDSIITDTAAEKQQDMAEVAARLMLPEEYRAKWYGKESAADNAIFVGAGGDNACG